MSLNMGPFGMVVLIVLIAVTAGLVRDWIRHRDSRPAAEDSPELLDELAQLRRRVEALEAIVTDGREDLRRRFRDLEP